MIKQNIPFASHLQNPKIHLSRIGCTGCTQKLRMPVFLTSALTGSHWFLSEEFLTGQSHATQKAAPRDNLTLWCRGTQGYQVLLVQNP